MKVRPMIVTFIAVTVLTSLSAFRPAPAAAHCPGTAPDSGWRAYAWGNQSVVGAGVTGVSTSLQWTDPNPCSNQFGNGFTLEAVTLCQTGVCNGWVQTGWIKRQGFSGGPKQTCEFAGEPGTDFWVVVDIPLPTASEYTYKFVHDAGDREWDCMRGSTVVAVRSSDAMGWQSGSYVNAQGEVNATHAQIGKMAPSKLQFSALQYQKSGSWSNMNVSLQPVAAPYGVDEPAVGQMRNWTNAH